jgi:hypothetical protein
MPDKTTEKLLASNKIIAAKVPPEVAVRANEGADHTIVADEVPVPPVQRSTCQWKPTQRMMESIKLEDLDLNLCAAMYLNDNLTCNDVQDPLSLMASTEKDTMYWHEAMKQHVAPQFWDTAMDEITSHHTNKHWEVIPIQDVPPDTDVLDYMWIMKHKRRLLTNKVYKHKARLYIFTSDMVGYSEDSPHTCDDLWLGYSTDRLYTGVPASQS